MLGDLVVIPGAQIMPGSSFYVAIYCESNCSYDLIVNLVSEFEVSPNVLYRVVILGDRESVFKYTHKNNTDVESIEIDAFSDTMTGFKMYVTRSK